MSATSQRLLLSLYIISKVYLFQMSLSFHTNDPEDDTASDLYLVPKLTRQPTCYTFVADNLIESRDRQPFPTNTSHPVDPTDTSLPDCSGRGTSCHTHPPFQAVLQVLDSKLWRIRLASPTYLTCVTGGRRVLPCPLHSHSSMPLFYCQQS